MIIAGSDNIIAAIGNFLPKKRNDYHNNCLFSPIDFINF